MKQLFLTLAILSTTVFAVNAQPISIDVNSTKVDGIIDSKIYGQLFEHIYFSANNGVWQELLFERSFEPEHFPGIAPRDGYFDGWFVDDDQVLHSPTRYEQPINITSVDGNEYEISMDINWHAFKLANRSWSGGLLDIRFAFRNRESGEPYLFRITDPYYEGRVPKEEAAAPNFAIGTKQEVEGPSFGGRTRKMISFVPMVLAEAKQGQIDEGGAWHHLKISCKSKKVTIYWDNKQVLSTNKLELADKNDIVFWVNYTETYYKNIKVTGASKKVLFSGIPEDVKLPDVAPQWKSFGNGLFALVKDDAVNMRYSQKITAQNQKSGIAQGPQNVVKGQSIIGSIYAKGDGKGKLSVSLQNGNSTVANQLLGTPGKDWTKYEFTLDAAGYEGDADFAIGVEGGTVQVDQATATTTAGKELGGFRPDLFKAVDELNPTCLRWPGGGYVAQYRWKWGIGPQEERERWPHWMWLDYDQNAFGTDEFIQFCRQINTEPVIVVSVAFERPEADSLDILQEACDWLAYCNEPATGKWGSVRAANGHPEPYNVKYWEIDNEMWEMGIERYEAAVRRFSKAMRAIDPDIKIIACGGFRGQDNDFIKRSGQYFDYLSLHHYEQPNGYASGPMNLQKQYNQYAEMIAASPNPNIKLFLSEWNLSSIDWRTGLFAGGFLNVCEKTPVVEMGAAALFLRRTDATDWNNAFINFDYKDYFVAPNYQVTKLWQDNFSKYRLGFTGETQDLNVVTTLAENGTAVIVKVVNPTETGHTLTVNGDWKGIESAQFQYYAPGDLTIANSMDNKNAVALKQAEITPKNNSVTINVEPLSAGVLIIKKTF